MITTRMNLMELYYILLTRHGKDTADRYYGPFVDYCVEISDDIIKKAMIFRSMMRKRDLSYVDCLGYIIAGTKKVKFLTGDKQFKDLPNVEFVK